MEFGLINKIIADFVYNSNLLNISIVPEQFLYVSCTRAKVTLDNLMVKGA